MRIHVNGVSLFFDTEGPSLEQHGPELRERPTVVAIHGGPGLDHSMYRPALSALARTAQVVYLDLRGNGRSERSTPDRWNLTTWAEDVRAFCDALGIHKPVVLGASFGGFVAQAYATRFPEHPGRLVLLSTNARFELTRSLPMFERLGGAEAAAIARRFFTDPTPDAFQQYVRVCYPLYSRQPAKHPSPAPIIHGDVALHFIGGEWHTFDFRKELGRIRCPTLVLAGEHDPVLPFVGSQELVSQLPPEQVRFERFPDCGHELLAERPDRVVALMEDFLRAG
ncbi:alpha/beta hydrolase [Pyxidicoccus fallax]|uniref:Alpha/beta hydrolase n=1 Tax=Pyxidicoccus fallax TaxID=394095 RepID=A0A848LI46_9BACT|nr:alpha/beta hydrolase [Pyxidicoccus fallax]NMO17348.1 alpha/beta hydrolase [Pyxidicoccus fallax]NPC81308.1 alpha/beta hydrolase [Pyxidicoccus fallax]